MAHIPAHTHLLIRSGLDFMHGLLDVVTCADHHNILGAVLGIGHLDLGGGGQLQIL